MLTNVYTAVIKRVRSLQDPQPKMVPAQIDFPLVGRVQMLQQLRENEALNINNFILQRVATVQYCCPLVHGAMGVGKTRIVQEFNPSLKDRLTEHPTLKDARIVNITMNFAAGDVMTYEDVDIRTALGLRLAAHFFFQQPGAWLRSMLGRTRDTGGVFSFRAVMSIISKTHYAKSSAPLLLTLQLDEFGLIEQAYLKCMLADMAFHMTSRHSLKVCLLPSLTGTTVAVGLSSIAASRLILANMLLQPLDQSETFSMVMTFLKGKVLGSRFASPAKVAMLRAALDTLGNNPRNISLFLFCLHEAHPDVVTERLLSTVLKRVVEQLNLIYQLPTWTAKMHISKSTVVKLCSWALGGKDVQMTDRLNGLTVEDARSSGILQLVHGLKTTATRFNSHK